MDFGSHIGIIFRWGVGPEGLFGGLETQGESFEGHFGVYWRHLGSHSGNLPKDLSSPIFKTSVCILYYKKWGGQDLGTQNYRVLMFSRKIEGK